MRMTAKSLGGFLAILFLLLWAGPSGAVVNVQCPGDTDGDAVIDNPDPAHPDCKCMHLGAGDGFVKMADGKVLYTFGFNDLTGIKDDPATLMDERLDAGMLAAAFPAPEIIVDEGDEFYLSLTNVGMVMRPDLFDPHTVHWHGFPNASAVFDGVPEASISINMGSTLTYYYHVMEPGTYMYHCHVEATEHMQMGMLGNLYVRPAQNRLPDGTLLGTHVHSNPDNPAGTTPRHLDDPLDGDTYAYNDGDGSTLYDVDYAIQLGGFDSNFHEQHLAVQPLPFAEIKNNYPMLNGRGYPDTVNPAPLTPPAENDGQLSQVESSLITANAGDTILLRLSSLDVQRFYTVATVDLPMKVIGNSARLLRGPSPDGGITPGKDLYYTTNSVTLGGGKPWTFCSKCLRMPPEGGISCIPPI